MPARPAIAVAVSALAALLSAGPAAADRSVEERLRDQPPTVVLGPDAGDEPGTRLLVREQGRSFCVDVATNTSGSGYDPGACGAVPQLDLREPFVLDVDRGGGDQPGGEPPGPPQRTVGGAVRAGVAAVEYDVARGGRVRIPTVAAPAALAGRPAGELRWFLGTLPAAGDVYARRLIAADGSLLAEEDSPFGIDDRPPARGPVRLASGRRWSLQASIERTLEPRLRDRGHRDRSLCIRLRTFAGIIGGSGLSGSCLPLPLAQPYVDFETSCGARAPQIVYGAAPRGRVPVTARLTDGRRRPVRAVPLPASLAAAGVVGFVVTVPRGPGVRSVTLPAGERPRHVPIGLPPDGLLPCGGVFATTPFEELGSGPPSPGGDVDHRARRRCSSATTASGCAWAPAARRAPASAPRPAPSSTTHSSRTPRTACRSAGPWTRA